MHQTSQPGARTRISLKYHLITFITHGCKVLQQPKLVQEVQAGELAMIKAGNCLMTEKLLENDSYKAVLFFFSPSFAQKIISGHKHQTSNETPSQLHHFIQDEYLHGFLAGISRLISSHGEIPPDLAEVKVKELLLYLQLKSAAVMQLLQPSHPTRNASLLLTEVVERNLHSDVSLEELAFLCNMSLSTFKRHFNKQYGMPAGQYFFNKKMERAALLLNSYTPGEVYHRLGYENYSSFSESFKLFYGISPRVYQQQLVNQ